MGGTIGTLINPVEGVKAMGDLASQQWENVKAGDISAVGTDIWEGHNYIMDPGGLFGINKDEYIQNIQASADIGGYGGKPRVEAREAEKVAAAQQAEIAKQTYNYKCDYCPGFTVVGDDPKSEPEEGYGIKIEFKGALPEDFPLKEIKACPKCLIKACDWLFKEINK